MDQSSRIKVLIVDDSFFMRKLLRDLLSKNSKIEIVGDAKDGVDAIGQIAILKPDVVTMDYNMPNMNGLMAVREILNSPDNPPAVLMISAHTVEGSQETFECLRAGAVDIVAKPSGELSLDIDKKLDEIVGKIIIASKAKVQKPKPLSPRHTKKHFMPSGSVREVVVIGASTGGPPVVENILAKLPADFKAAVLVAQHMPEGFTASFAERLNGLSGIPVKLAKTGDIVTGGQCLVAPGDHHTHIESKIVDGKNQIIVIVSTEPREIKLSPSINILMESAAKVFGRNVIGVECTGMGEDGLLGAQAIKKEGGVIIAQSLDTAVVDSMPGEIIKAKLADMVLSPDQISHKLSEYTE